MLIGREAERRAIERLVAGARVGSSGVLLITGEPGIGKTTLLDQAAAPSAGLRLLRARGTETEHEVPFGGLLQLLRPALGELDRIPPPQKAALEAALALTTPGDSTGRFAVGAATLSLLCRYAEQAPLAVLVDDAQWIDRPSAEALVFAARRLVADPIVLLIAAREGESHPLAEADLPVLRLDGLGLDDARELVGRRTADVAQVHRMVGGNPLALLELNPQSLHRIRPGAPVPVPRLLAEAFSAQADRLSPEARIALLVAASDDGELQLVAAVCDKLKVDIAVLAEAEDAGLIRIGDGRVEFRHPLVRSSVYAGAAAATRRSVHQAIAGVLADSDRQVWHLSEAALGSDDEVARRLEIVAGHAVERGAHAVAATALERAARLTDDAAEQARRLVAAGEAAWFAGLPERAEELLVEALGRNPAQAAASAGSANSAASRRSASSAASRRSASSAVPRRVAGDAVAIHAQELRGDIAVRCGSPGQARDILLAAADAADDLPTRIRLLGDIVNACFYLGDTNTALRVAEELDAILPSIDQPESRLLGLLASGVARVFAGSGGSEQIRTAVTLSSTVKLDRRHQVWVVLAPMFLREREGGRDMIQQVLRDSRDGVALGMLPGVLFHLARDQATTDRWADAAASYDEGIRLSRETGQTTELAINLAGQAWLSARRGRVDECRAQAAEAIGICTAREIRLGLAWSSYALGDLELGLGDVAAALAAYDRLVGILTTGGMHDPDLSPAPELVEVYLRLGRPEDAARTARDFAEQATRKGLPWSLARAARAQGLVNDDEHAFETALRLHERTLDLFETARTHLAYGSWLRRVRRRVDARVQLRAAVGIFDHLGAGTWADQAAGELKATGETARRREHSSADDLTPQERQVAQLLADGHSTREAAAKLFLSPKTVEYHLRKVYTKLGIHSRAELAEQLTET
ncbi:helix-turn-helix transcriptional regulator [Kribbella lupini]|uniref:LuxR family transcriptional regulator n=1 Tax=Kribbella lupini TaxID=291602 RepID=A0ABN2BYY2_9ACTN